MFNYEALQIILQEGAGEVIQYDMQGHMMRWREREKKNRLRRKQFALSR